MRYSGGKALTYNRWKPVLEQVLMTIVDGNPDSISIAEPCCGTAFLTIKAVEWLRRQGFTGRITVYLNDLNTVIIRLLGMLLEGRGSELIEDPDYIQKAVSMRAGIASDTGYVHQGSLEKFQRNRPKLLHLFDEIHTSFVDVVVELSSMRSTEFIRALPVDLDLLLFDPPYIGMMVKYLVNDYGIEDYVEDVGLIHKFAHYLIFNDVISKHLHCHVDDQSIEYVVRGTGLRAGRNRVELCYWR
jgi:hypothetical protein